LSAIGEDKPAGGKKNAPAAVVERMEKSVEAKKDYTDEVRRQVEENYSSFVKSQITCHEFLMNAAEHKALTGHREFVEGK
jgi:hypothetical protein